MSSINRTEVRIESLNHARILNGLLRKDIKILHCTKAIKLLTIVVNSYDIPKLQEYFDECGYNYIVSRQMGPKYSCKLLLKRYGLIIGILVSMIFIILISSTILKINVTGLENVSSVEVERVIEENSIKKYMFKRKVNLSELNRSICALEGVASVSLNIKGVNLFINVQEELPKGDVPSFDFQGIYAEYDTIITKIIVQSGTALVKSGDAVKAGAMLIAPYYKLDEENIVAVPARGEIYGRMWIKEDIYFYSEIIERVETGNKKTLGELYIAGLLVGKKPSAPFAIYDKNVRKSAIYNVIPIEIIYHTYYEIEEKMVTHDFESEKNALIADKEREIEKNIERDKTILRKWNIIKNIDKIYIISIYYELEGRVDAYLLKEN